MCSLETIPEEAELPRISKLIPKSPETIKRERDNQRLCDKYLNDKNLKLYYAMLVTNKNFRKVCLDTDFYGDNVSERHNCKKCANTSGTKCSVGTSIPKEDVAAFYRKNVDEKKIGSTPLKQMDKNIKVRNDLSRNGSHGGRGVCSLNEEKTKIAKVIQKRNVSTSIPAEDIKMLCANLARFNGGLTRRSCE